MTVEQTTWSARDLHFGQLAVVVAETCDDCGQPIPDGEAWAGTTEHGDVVVFCSAWCRTDYFEGDDA